MTPSRRRELENDIAGFSCFVGLVALLVVGFIWRTDWIAVLAGLATGGITDVALNRFIKIATRD